MGEREGRRGVLHISGPTGETDAGFSCVAQPIEEGPAWIVGWEPLIDATHGEDVVHHMDVFLCHRSVTEKWDLGDADVCSTDAFMLNYLETIRPGRPKKGVGSEVTRAMRDARRKPTKNQLSGCNLFLAYDKGAVRYMLPEGYGFEIGPGTASEHRIVLQNHFLVPSGWGSRGVRDSSGMRLFLTDKRPDHIVAGFAMNDFGLQIPPSLPAYHYSFEMSAGILLRSPLVYDLKSPENGKGVRFVAAHLHAHNLARRMWIDHMRGGVKVGEVARIDEYSGYGPDQTFFHVLNPSAPLFEVGDGLVVNCVFNSTEILDTTQYGVSHGTEMCAAFVVYAYHDTSALPRYGNMPSVWTQPGRSGSSLI